MIPLFTIANFKAFGDMQEIRMRPLTLIYGVNSSGKSSILQSLLLLSQSEGAAIYTKGKMADLGSFKSLSYRKNGDDIEVSFTYNLRDFLNDRRNFHKLMEFGQDNNVRQSQYFFRLFHDETLLSSYTFKASINTYAGETKIQKYRVVNESDGLFVDFGLRDEWEDHDSYSPFNHTYFSKIRKNIYNVVDINTRINRDISHFIVKPNLTVHTFVHTIKP